ncbi:MAG: hypothetical protein E6Q73_02785 [Pseudorhodobacter sp.]|nr:MAG: hypothetical protein E6Q73_02785 [Pseudorhodobacter sp.]
MLRYLLCVPCALILGACQPTVPVGAASIDRYRCPTPPAGSYGNLTDPQGLAWHQLRDEDLIRLPEYWEKLIAHGTEWTVDAVISRTAPGGDLVGLDPPGWRNKLIAEQKLRIEHHCAAIMADSPF